MSPLRKISALGGVTAPSNWRARAGKPPYLAFIDIDRLVVEENYQRVIGKQGEVNVKRIVNNFRWSRFAPIIVAPLDDRLYAVIDGQHRATALATLGERTAPCVVYEVDFASRADAYAALNVAVTSLTPQAKFYALLGAGDVDAKATYSIAQKHSVEILKFNCATSKMKARETSASAALIGIVRQYGQDVLDLVLRSLCSHPNFRPGYLCAVWLRATAFAIAEDVRLFRRPDQCVEAFGHLDLFHEHEEALGQSRQTPGSSATRLLANRIKIELQCCVLRRAEAA